VGISNSNNIKEYIRSENFGSNSSTQHINDIYTNDVSNNPLRARLKNLREDTQRKIDAKKAENGVLDSTQNNDSSQDSLIKKADNLSMIQTLFTLIGGYMTEEQQQQFVRDIASKDKLMQVQDNKEPFLSREQTLSLLDKLIEEGASQEEIDKVLAGKAESPV
jgi:hypothetical protein